MSTQPMSDPYAQIAKPLDDPYSSIAKDQAPPDDLQLHSERLRQPHHCHT